MKDGPTNLCYRGWQQWLGCSILVWLGILSLPGMAWEEPSTRRPPNILFIAVDDMRCELGCYGSPVVRTPNIDRFAASGVLFRHAYCQQAVCNPSRVSLMTGLRPDTTRVWDLTTEMRSVMPDVVTLPQHFRQHGYRAVAYGKIFHNPFPDAASWDEPTHNATDVIGHSEANRKLLAETKRQMEAAGKPPGLIDRLRGPATEIQDEPDERNYDGKQTMDAIAKLNALVSEQRPFFLAVGYIRPHLPFITPKPYWEMYDRKSIPLAKNGWMPKGAPKVSMGDRSMGGFYELRSYLDYREAPSPFEAPLSESQQRELKHGYYASVSFVDAQIGRLLQALEASGASQQTVVVLWSDHGWKLGEHGSWCKQTNYEIDTRAPLIMRDPSLGQAGKTCESLVEFIDIYPTLCDVAGIPMPSSLEGTSMKPLLIDPTLSIKEGAFSQFPRVHAGRDYMGYAMRTREYRYIEWLDAVSGEITDRELYDHRVDSDENENLAGKEDLLPVLDSLHAQMWKSLKIPTFPLGTVRQVKELGGEANGDQGATLTFHAVTDDSEIPASKPQGAFRSVNFRNATQASVDLVWIGPDGSRKTYATLKADETFRIRTRPGIVWSIQNTEGKRLGYFQIQPGPGERLDAVIDR